MLQYAVVGLLLHDIYRLYQLPDASTSRFAVPPPAAAAAAGAAGVAGAAAHAGSAAKSPKVRP